jgi:hypothetical protein
MVKWNGQYFEIPITKIQESLNFERGLDPKKALGVGISHRIEKFIDDMKESQEYEPGIIEEFYYDWEDDEMSITFDAKIFHPWSHPSSGLLGVDHQWADISGTLTHDGKKYIIHVKGSEWSGNRKLDDFDDTYEYEDTKSVIRLLKDLAQ